MNNLKSIFSINSSSSPFIIAGPCSAESEIQVIKTAKAIEKCKKVKIFRAGIWKPRTSPSSFEGVGKVGLRWLERVKKETQLFTAVEAAIPDHIETCLKYKKAVDIIWIGARTTANPFSVQSIADTLKGVDIPVMIKNPVNPDIGLWSGAVERLMKAGIKQLALIHRGFSPFVKTNMRNIPKWELAIELRSRFPELPIINDPSHISGNKKYIHEIAQKALNLNFNGLMIETHNNPSKALSDAHQQLTPDELIELIKNLKFRKQNSENQEFSDSLEQYREQIDSIDFQLLELLSKRMSIIENIGRYKLENNVTIFQLKRWLDIVKTRKEFGKLLNLDEIFIKKIIQRVHKESIRKQAEIMNNKNIS